MIIDGKMSPDGDEAVQQNIDIFRGLTPRPTQQRFIECPAPRKAYIGNFGTGKTEVLAWQAIILSHLFPNNVGLIGRYTYGELRDTTRKRFVEIADPALIRKASIPEDGGGYIEWKCGGVTLFRNLEDVEHFKSLELGYAGIDEVTECPHGSFMILEARVGRHWGGRRPMPYSPLFCVGNPAGRDYIWQTFFKPGHDEKMYRGFQPHPMENADALPPNYYTDLKKGKPDWWIRRFIKGEMTALEGLIWPNFDEAIHVVKAFKVPETWRRVTGHDHGRRNPTACLWVAVDPDGNLICYRDYERAGPTPAEHCRAILKVERRYGDKIDYRVADPSMFSKSRPDLDAGGKWHSVAEDYESYGITLQPGDNAMEATLTRVSTLLWEDPDHKYPYWHPQAGKYGSPHLFFFDLCERTIEEVSSWKFKEYAIASLGLREEPVDHDDHLCDTLRYVATSFPEPTEGEKKVIERTASDLQIIRKKRMGAALRKAAADAYWNEIQEMIGYEDY